MNTKTKMLFLILTISLTLGLIFLITSLFKTQNRVEIVYSSNHVSREKVDNFRLLDHLGKIHELYYYSNAKAIVLITHGTGCAIVRLSIPQIKKLRDRYKKKGVLFFMINANPQDDHEGILKQAKEFDVDLPILIDETQLIAKSLGVSRTAEAVLIQPNDWTIAYRGAIDDQLGYETQKADVSHNYLSDAINALINGKLIKIDKTNTKGCLIYFENMTSNTTTEISYGKEVVSILENKCIACHREGGIAPWAMSSYRKVKGWGAMIREVIRTKRMPPWNADQNYGTFSNDFSLSVKEAKTLVQWIEAGMPRGGDDDSLPQLDTNTTPEGMWPLGKPDFIVPVKKQDIPATGILEYRYVTVPLDLEEEVWLRAIDIRPSNRKVLHHAGAQIVYSKGLQKEQFQMLGGRRRLLGVFTPGSQELPFPEGTGKNIPKGSQILLVLHYTVTGKPEIDEPKIGLYFHKEKPLRRLRTARILNKKFKIPPGAPEHEVVATRTFKQDVLLYEMKPHMHYRGRWAKVEAHYPDGSSEVLLSVPDYNFNWQHSYRLAQPKKLPSGTTLICKGAFDNSPQNPANPNPKKWVMWGQQSWNEMFGIQIHYTEIDEAEISPVDP